MTAPVHGVDTLDEARLPGERQPLVAVGPPGMDRMAFRPDVYVLIQRYHQSDAPFSPSIAHGTTMIEKADRQDFQRIREALGKSVHFDTLAARDLDRLARLGTVARFQADELIHPAWQPADKLWVVLSGGIRVVLPNEDGSAFTATVIGQGNYYSAGSFVPAAIVATEAHALRHTELAVFDMKRLQQEFRHDEHITMHFLGLIHQRLAALLSVYRDSMTAPLPERLARRLLAEVTTTAGAAGEEGTVSYVSQNELARMLGASRSRVNATLRRLEATGAIRLGYRKIVIKDVARLVEAAGSAVTPF
jgi:CRP/FNR family transcriptional regulator, cyclic AMP receptor protein